LGVAYSGRSTTTSQMTPVAVANTAPIATSPAPSARAEPIEPPAALEPTAAPAAASVAVPTTSQSQQVANPPAPARSVTPKKAPPVDKMEARRLRVAEDLRRERLSQEPAPKPKFHLSPSDSPTNAAPSRTTIY